MIFFKFFHSRVVLGKCIYTQAPSKDIDIQKVPFYLGLIFNISTSSPTNAHLTFAIGQESKELKSKYLCFSQLNVTFEEMVLGMGQNRQTRSSFDITGGIFWCEEYLKHKSTKRTLIESTKIIADGTNKHALVYCRICVLISVIY